MFPQLNILGPVEAEIVCQNAIRVATPTPGRPAARNQKLSELGITDAGMVLLIDSLVQAVRGRNCTLDPAILNGITCSCIYGALVDLVEQASRP